MEKIDFVILWVDGNDLEWRREKEKYEKSNEMEINRYREWDNLQYWFRGVEKFAPWVNKIHFITWGHVPKWLNTKHPKLNIVKHQDYIPQEYLPTFNSNVIELNLHRIKDLEEKFVLFNDDMFLCKNVEEKDFFKNGKPCEMYAENINMPIGYNNSFSHTALNNIGIINKYFKKREVMKKNIGKYINFKYGIDNLRTLFLLPWPQYAQFKDPHLPVALLKSTLKLLWEKEKEAFNTTSKNRFRENTDINQYLIRYWQLLTGNFYPRSRKIGKYFEISNYNENMLNAIEKQKYKMICMNDVDSTRKIDFEKIKNTINKSFDKILSEKSKFEKEN